MDIKPYLMFDGRAEEVIEFYKKALGAKVEVMMRYNQSPEPCAPGMVPAGWENKVMHSSLRIGDSVVMVSDTKCGGQGKFDGVTLTLSAADEAEVERLFNALAADGGQVQMPLTKTFFSPRFGTLQDRFGVSWIVLVSQ